MCQLPIHISFSVTIEAILKCLKLQKRLIFLMSQVVVFFLSESPLIPMLSYLALVLDVECFVINVSCLYLLLRPRNIPNVRSFLISLSFYIFFVTHFKSTKLHFSKNDILMVYKKTDEWYTSDNK